MGAVVVVDEGVDADLKLVGAQRGFFQIKSHRKEASKPIARGRRHRKNELLERFSANSTDGPWR